MDEKYKLGIDFIDQQHAMLFDILEDAKSSKNCKDLKIVIKRLKDYTVYHFTEEEEYFNSIGYKDAEEHAHIHSLFIETVNFYSLNLDRSTSGKIIAFLSNWIKTHILVEDRKFLK